MSEDIKELIRQEVARQVAEAKKIKRATVDVKDVAAYLGVCIDTVQELCRKKEIPHTKLRGRYVFRLDKIDEWMTEQEKINSGRAS